MIGWSSAGEQGDSGSEILTMYTPVVIQPTMGT